MGVQNWAPYPRHLFQFCWLSRFALLRQRLHRDIQFPDHEGAMPCKGPDAAPSLLQLPFATMLPFSDGVALPTILSSTQNNAGKSLHCHDLRWRWMRHPRHCLRRWTRHHCHPSCCGVDLLEGPPHASVPVESAGVDLPTGPPHASVSVESGERARHAGPTAGVCRPRYLSTALRLVRGARALYSLLPLWQQTSLTLWPRAVWITPANCAGYCCEQQASPS